MLRELALHVMDIAENSVTANATAVIITVEEDLANDRLKLSVHDNGKGMSAEKLANLQNPFITSRTTRKVGLGIPFLKEAAEACNGHMQVTSQIGQGTCVQVDFQRSHIDRMPLGDVAGTVLSLVVGYPQVHWTLRYRFGEKEFVFDDSPIKQELGDVPLSEPGVLTFVREMLEQGIQSIVVSQ